MLVLPSTLSARLLAASPAAFPGDSLLCVEVANRGMAPVELTVTVRWRYCPWHELEGTAMAAVEVCPLLAENPEAGPLRAGESRRYYAAPAWMPLLHAMTREQPADHYHVSIDTDEECLLIHGDEVKELLERLRS